MLWGGCWVEPRAGQHPVWAPWMGTTGVTPDSVDPGTGMLDQLEPVLVSSRPCVGGKQEH